MSGEYMQKLMATLPDGRIVTRTTDREYKFVLAVKWDGRWQPYRWSTRKDLVERAQKECGMRETSVVPVVPLTGRPRRAKHVKLGAHYGRQEYWLQFHIPDYGSVEVREHDVAEMARYAGANSSVSPDGQVVTLYRTKSWDDTTGILQRAETFGWRVRT